MYYPCSENKGADKLRGYREADLRLCFRICRLLVFPWNGSFEFRGEAMPCGNAKPKLYMALRTVRYSSI